MFHVVDYEVFDSADAESTDAIDIDPDRLVVFIESDLYVFRASDVDHVWSAYVHSVFLVLLFRFKFNLARKFFEILVAVLVDGARQFEDLIDVFLVEHLEGPL